MTAKKKEVKGFSPFRRYAMDNKAETDGIWFDYEGGSRLLVARYGNPEHQKLERQLEAKYADRLNSEDEETKTEARVELNRQVFAKTVLKGWEGILDEDANELKYTPEAAEKLLELPEVFGAVLEFAAQIEKFRRFKEEDAVKN